LAKPQASSALHRGDRAPDERETAREPLAGAVLAAALDPYVLLRPIRDRHSHIVDFAVAVANDAAVTFFEVDRELVPSRSLLTLLPALRSTAVMRLLVDVAKGKAPLVIDDLAMDNPATGKPSHFDARGVKIDKLIGLTWRDVTERHLLTQRFQFLAENANDLVLLVDPAGQVEWTSPSVERMLGYPPEEVRGRPVIDLVATEDTNLARAMLQGNGTRGLEVRLPRRDGEMRRFSVGFSTVRSSDGVVIAYVAGLHDVTDQSVALAQLAQSEALYRLLADNMSDVVVLVGPTFDFLWVSPSVSEVLGWRPSDFLGRDPFSLIHPDDHNLVRTAFAEHRGGRREVDRFRYLCSDGSWRWMSGRARHTGLADDEERGWVMQLRDITSEVASRDRLLASEERFRMFAENARDVVYSVDGGGIVTWVSPSIERVFGVAPSDVVGRPSLDFIHPEDHATIVRARGSAGGSASLEVRFVNTAGEVHWVSSEVHRVNGAHGERIGAVIGLKVIDTEVQARQSLVRSEQRFRLLAENASDVVYQFGRDRRLLWVSPSVTQVLGWEVGELVGMVVTNLVHPDDVHLLDEGREQLLTGRSAVSRQVRYRRSNGDYLWMEATGRTLTDANGEVTSVVVALRNVHREHLTQRALATLSAGGKAVAHATTELQLLEEVCRIAVAVGGYACVWYGRKVHDAAHSIAKLASSDEHRDYMESIEVSWADEPIGRGPIGRAMRSGQTVVTRDFADDTRMQPWTKTARAHGFRSSVVLPVLIDCAVDGTLQVYDSVPDAFDSFTVSVLEDLVSELGVGIKRLRETDLLTQTLDNQQLLISAVEEAADAIVIADPEARIIYANPATLRSSGYSLDELSGQNPRILQSGLHPSEFYEQMWRELLAGRSWRGEIFNRRKSGELYEEDVTISPVRNALGTLVAYVAVKHDLTIERQLRQDLSREHQDRTAVVEVMRQLRAGRDLSSSAQIYCDALTNLAGIDTAGVLITRRDGSLVPIALSGNSLVELGVPLEVDWPATLADVRSGPIRVDLDAAAPPGMNELPAATKASGITGLVMSPIRHEGNLVGVLALGTRDTTEARTLEDRFAYFEELGAYAGSLFGAQIVIQGRADVERARVHDVIDHHRYTTVFQPLVSMTDGSVVGFEALTRFESGEGPEATFATAQEVGMGPELEEACARSALELATSLPEGTFLNVNFSHDAILQGCAQRVVAGLTRPLVVVVELTEYDPVSDYVELRAAIDACEGCMLAVDDAGNGYAGLTHILELRPEFIKLDRALVHNLGHDAAREAMVAGICHFAAQSGTRIVAEGVETADEAAALRRLGQMRGPHQLLAQGYHFGRPVSRP
jgi:PAS domain S-box-containing protein